MTGTPLVAAWIAEGAFWVLLATGFWSRELGGGAAVTFLALWVGGFVGASHLPYGDALFSPYLGCLDVALALTVFKGDVRLT